MGVLNIYTAILAAIMATYGLLLVIGDIIGNIERWRHRKKEEARIIAQAKASGDWDRKPLALGGRALELKAWEDFKIKREPGETDAQLRRRCMAAADNELANTPREGENE